MKMSTMSRMTGRRLALRTLLATAVVAVAMPTFNSANAADAALVAAAEKEGQLVIYGDGFLVPLLVKGFSAKYPNVKVTSATGDAWMIYNRYVSEQTANRPVMDVFYQAEDTIITASEAGYLAPLNVAATADLQPMAVPKSGYYALGNGTLCLFAWNPEALGKKPSPKDWTDYANPPADWNGLVATTNPGSSSATFAVIAGLYQAYGPAKGGDILKGLKKVNGELAASMGVMGTKLQTGERPILFFTNTTSIARLKEKSVPVQFVVPATGAVAQFNAIAISKAAPHPNAGRLFADWVLTDGQTVLVEVDAHALKKGMAAPKGFPSLTEAKLLPLDLPKALKERDAILNWWAASTGFNYK
jgi:iron(III) transport system substrate-binding protein